MNIVWVYTAIGLLAVSAAVVIASGEPATAELKLAEAATSAAAAGAAVVCFLATPGVATPTPDRKTQAP